MLKRLKFRETFILKHNFMIERRRSMENIINGISVIIPYYKGEKYIDYTLEKLFSALEYSGINYEIIVINDSPEENLSRYENMNPYLKIINNSCNKGIAYSRNKGKELAQYNYIYFIDQDDWVEKEFFLEAYKYIKKEYDIIICNYNLCKDNSIKRYYNILFIIYINFITPRSLIKYGNLFKTPGQLIVRKSLVNNFIETKAMGADDFYLFLDLFSSKTDRKIKYIRKPLFFYRVHNTNYSNITDFQNSSLECFKEYKKINDRISKYEKYLIKRYSGSLYSNTISRMVKRIITF